MVYAGILVEGVFVYHVVLVVVIALCRGHGQVEIHVNGIISQPPRGRVVLVSIERRAAHDVGHCGLVAERTGRAQADTRELAASQSRCSRDR